MKRLFLRTSLVLALPMMASADIIVHTANFGPSTVPFAGGVTLEQFSLNPALLTKVTLEINAALQADVTVENNTGVGVSAQAWIFGTATATGPSGLSPTANFGVIAGPVVLWPSDGVSGSGPDFTNFGGTLTDTVSDSDSTVNPLEFGPFLGAGTFPVSLFGIGGWALYGVSDPYVEVRNFEGSGTVTVTYDYISTPGVPDVTGTLPMLGMALAGLAGLARRMRA